MIKTKDDKVYVSLDIGADMTKSAFAYRDMSGAYHFEKAFHGGYGVPSIAYYNGEGTDGHQSKNWVFDIATINSMAAASFQYIVRIMDLLDLCKAGDFELYEKEKMFKNFYYPPREKETYRTTIQNGHCFKADMTPRQVCRAFVQYCVDKLKKEVAAMFGTHVDIVYVVVYPAFAELDYIKELRSFVLQASGAADDDVIIFSAPKSVGVAAKEFGILDKEKDVLIFNMGENEISVVKAKFGSNNIMTYGADGHCPPADIGGRNIDYCLAGLLQEHSAAIQSFGNNIGGEMGEQGSYYNQYCMQQEIKAGKTIFGNGKSYERAGKRVPFTVFREMLTEIPLTKDEFVLCCQEVFERVWQYIARELSLEDNKGIDAIIMSGGAADTFGLDSYIRAKLKASKYRKVKYIDFSPANEQLGYDDILCDSKDTVPIGAALFGAGKYAFSMMTTRSYGTYNFVDSTPCYSEIVRKGEIIPIRGKLVEGECFAAPVPCPKSKRGDEWFINNEYYKCDTVADNRERILFEGYQPHDEDHDAKDEVSSFMARYESKNTATVEMRVIGYYKLSFVFPKDFDCTKYGLKNEGEVFEWIADSFYIETHYVIALQEGFRIDSEGRATPVAICHRAKRVGKLRTFDDVEPYSLMTCELKATGSNAAMNLND